MKTKHTKRKPLQIVIIVLSIFTVINICIFFGCLVDEVTPYQPSERSILYTLQNGDYTYLRSDLGYYTDKEIANSDTLSECYAIMLYFENSVLYHAYASTDPTQAALYQVACQENAAQMGELSYYAAQIDALF